MIMFTVWGDCHGKGRPKFKRVGSFVRTYTDETTTNYENLVKLSYINSGSSSYLNNETLKAYIRIYQSIPKSESKKKQAKMLSGELRPTKKPDIDNVLKSIFDALNKVAFNDDTQIVEIQCAKYYSNEPRVEIVIEEIVND